MYTSICGGQILFKSAS